MNHLEEAKKAISDYEAKNLNIDTLKAQAHALIAIAETQVGVFASLSATTSHLAVIAEQLEKKNDIKLLGSREFAIKWEEDK